MVSSFKRNKINSDTYYTVITDKKFKTNSWRINFCINLEKADCAAVSIASNVISSCNAKNKTMAEVNSLLDRLYDADLFSSVSKRGDVLVVTVGASSISSKYALGNEDLEKETAELLLNSIFMPNTEDGGFEKNIFEIKKRDLIDAINSEINDKRRYAFVKAGKLIYENEPAAKPLYGTIEEAEKIDAKKCLEEWNKLIANSSKEIFFVGSEELPQTDEMIVSRFMEVEEKNAKPVFNSPSICKKTPAESSDKMDVAQSKIVMAFKTDSDDDDQYVMRLFSLIFGGLPSSRLFKNIREKQSLCYYCQSSYNYPKQTLIVDCGVESCNIEKAKEAVLLELEEIKESGISDSELKTALIYMENSLKGCGDVPSSYINWYFERICSGSILSPWQSAEEYKRVTKEQLHSAAKSLKLDTFYCIEPLNKGEYHD